MRMAGLALLVAAVSAAPTSVSAQASAQLVVTSASDGAAVYLDGALAGTTPFVGLVTPGSHLVELAPITGPRERRVASVPEGTSLVVDFGDLPVVTAPGVGARPTPHGPSAGPAASSALGLAGWAIGAVGAASLTLAIVSAGIHEDAILAFNDSVRAAGCPGVREGRVPPHDGYRATNVGCFDLEATWRTWGPLRDGFAIGGALLLAIGTTLVVLGHLDRPGRAPSDEDADATDVARGVEATPPTGARVTSVACGPFAELGLFCVAELF